MGKQDDRDACGSSSCGCGSQPQAVGRRDFLALTSLGAAASLLIDRSAVAGPFEEKDFEQLVRATRSLTRIGSDA